MVAAHDAREEAGPAGLAPFRTAWWQRLLSEQATYELARFGILRLLGLVYFVAFAILVAQGDALLGSRGLLPVAKLIAFKRSQVGAEIYWRMPSIFWIASSDAVLRSAAWLGLALSAAAMLGATNALLQLALWVLYTSFVHVGQIFYGYGWEIQLLETGFIAVFLCPVRTVKPWPDTACPRIVMWLMRWLIFRIMMGAALIKLRNDPCWRDLTCLDYHFETQPNPHPLSYWFHHAPHWFHALQVLFNYLAELVAPWFAFGFRRWRHVAGVVLIAFQVSIGVTGNLSFLNWLTIVPALACFDDTAFGRLVPARLRPARERMLERFALLSSSKAQLRAVRVFAVLVALLSVAPVLNLASCEQAMNTSFDPLALVNTYGAFGSVDRARYEVILEGTRAETPDESARWEEYELPCMPGDTRRRPCLVTPYHYRLDWQMWFVGNGAARGESIDGEPWLVHLVWDLLSGERAPRSLLARDPFPDAPPRWIRAGIWHYRFTDSLASGQWWERERVGEYLRPVSRDDPVLRAYVEAFDWLDEEGKSP
jgi:hypothetical protein